MIDVINKSGVQVRNADVRVISVTPVISRSLHPMPPAFTLLRVGLRLDLSIDGKRKRAVSSGYGIEPIRDALLRVLGDAVDDEESWGLAAHAEDLPVDETHEPKLHHRVERHEARFQRWYSCRSGYTHDQREIVATVALGEGCVDDLLSDRSSRRANARLQHLAGDMLCGVGARTLPEMSFRRLRALLPGFLRALEREVVEFVDGRDWNWHDMTDPDCCGGKCPPVVEYEHPDRLLERVRAARRAAEGVFAMTEVMAE